MRFGVPSNVELARHTIPPLWKNSGLRLPAGRLRTPGPLSDNRRALNGVPVTPSSAPFRCKSSPIRKHIASHISPPPTKPHQPSHRKTREKRSVSVVHNCAEKIASILENIRQPAAVQPTRILHSGRLCNSGYPLGGCTSGAASWRPIATGDWLSRKKRISVSIVFFNQQPVRT